MFKHKKGCKCKCTCGVNKPTLPTLEEAGLIIPHGLPIEGEIDSLEGYTSKSGRRMLKCQVLFGGVDEVTVYLNSFLLTRWRLNGDLQCEDNEEALIEYLKGKAVRFRVQNRLHGERLYLSIEPVRLARYYQ